MKLKSAIKKLSKLTKVEKNGGQYSGVVNGNVIEFRACNSQEEDTGITCIRVRSIKDEDDSMTDYFAGVWCNNLSRAIKVATAA